MVAYPIVVVGCLEETLDTLQYLYSMKGRVDAVITLTKDLCKSSNWVDLTSFCQEHNIPLFYGSSYPMKQESDLILIQSLKPEVILVLGWQRLLPEPLIQVAKLGCVGFHGSANFLPWGRGRSPINWSIIEAQERFILHMFFITPGVDDGDIIGFEIYDITPEDTCRSVYYKTAMAQARLVQRFTPAIQQGTCPRYPQVGTIFHYPKRTPEDGLIDWSQSRQNILRLVRAVTEPYPGAVSYIKGQQVLIWECRDFGNSLLLEDKKAGEIVFISSNDKKEWVVVCGDGAILVTQYQTNAAVQIGDVFDVA